MGPVEDYLAVQNPIYFDIGTLFFWCSEIVETTPEKGAKFDQNVDFHHCMPENFQDFLSDCTKN